MHIQNKCIRNMETIDIEIGRLRERIQGQELKTVIIPHISADGDAVGACSAFQKPC